MAHSIFRREDGCFLPSAHARGPWDPGALHGGAPAALLTHAFERLEPGAELAMARLGFEFLRPIPLAPLSLETRLVRDGRRVQELSGELRSDDQLVCRATALRVLAVPPGLPPPAAPDARRERALPGPDQGREVRFTLDGSSSESFAASAMQMRWLDPPFELAPARVWMRLRRQLIAGEEPTPLVRLVASADFGNGVSAALPFESYVFINADLTIHLSRAPRGEWIGLDSRTVLQARGAGLAESVLHDRYGAVGRAFQALVVQPR